MASSTNPSQKELIINDLALLCNSLNPVASKCFALGLQLGVQYPRIRNIDHNYRNCEDKLREIISERLKQDSHLTWHDIVTALRTPTVGEYSLASQIEQEHLLQPLTLVASSTQSVKEIPYSHSQSQKKTWQQSHSPVRRPSDRGHHRSRSPVKGPSDRGDYKYQPPLRKPSDWKHHRPRSPVRELSDRRHYKCRSPLRDPTDTEHYRSQSPVKGHSDRVRNRSQSSVRGPSDRGHYKSRSPVRGPSDKRYYREMTPYQMPPPSISCTPQPYPLSCSHSQRNSNMESFPARKPHLQTNPEMPPTQGTNGSRRMDTFVHYVHPHQMPCPQATHFNTLSIPPHFTATSLISVPPARPLQEGVRGQLESQSHMSHGQLETSHVQSQIYLSRESCLPPAKRPYLQSNPELPLTQGSNASHSVMSAHHRSPMDTFVHYIKVTYKQCDIEKSLNVLKWPPTPSKIFINLACIDWESIVSKEEADEYTRAMVEDGNVDAIMKRKTNIDFDDIVRDFPDIDLEKVVLVEGAPGVGKSTFAWEFCRRWERGEIAQQFQLVLLLRLRDERMSRAKKLKDLIYHSSEDVCLSVVDALESTLGMDTLIILEGFDELPNSQRREPSIFLQLIHGQLLPLATILVTSRPWATGTLLVKIKHRIFQHIEILGFTENNIINYVASVFTGENKKTACAIDQMPDEGSDEAKKKVDDVMAYICKYPQIKACMYIPLNAAIVVSIYRESMKSKWVLPTTLTELYQALIRILLLRYLHGNAEYSHQKWSIESFKNLPEKVYSQFLDICKIAYGGVCREGGKSVKLIFSDLPDNFETLGLVQSVSQLFMDGQKTSHNFLHLTVQEFLAAFFISTMSSAGQQKHFQRHKDGRLRVVLRFLAGLTKLNKITVGLPTVAQRRTPCCNHINWLFEAQNSKLLQSLFHKHTASFTLTNAMPPLEYYSLGYCIAHSQSNWSLTCHDVIEEEKLHMLVRGAKPGDDHYRVTLITTSKCMTPKKMGIILSGFSPCVETLCFKIYDNHNSLSLPPLSALHRLELLIYDNNNPFNISCDLSSSSLEVLSISSSCEGTILEAKTCEAIGNLLMSSTSLKEFKLSPNGRITAFSPHVSNENIERITKGLGDNVDLPLKTLNIDCKCAFTTTATTFMVEFITRSTTLECLKIHIDTFKGVNVFAKGLSDNIALPLKTLDIDCKCTFTTAGTRSLVQFITRSTTLQYIRMCHVTFSAQRLIELIEAIHHSTRLLEKKLEELSFRVECSKDVINLKHMIRDHPKLRKSIDWKEVVIIHTSSIEFRQMMVSTLSLALKYGNITSLDLTSKSICDAGAEALALALRCNSTLERLYLSNNCISDAGSVALAQALHNNSTLERLYLSNNSISDAGSVAIAQALHCNSTLEWLYLFTNGIGDTGAVALAQSLHYNSTLERLDLSVNDAIGKNGTHHLVQALTVNTSITTYGLTLSMRCLKYATQCTQYNTVKDRIWFS